MPSPAEMVSDVETEASLPSGFDATHTGVSPASLHPGVRVIPGEIGPLSALLMARGQVADVVLIMETLFERMRLGRDPTVREFYGFLANQIGGVNGFFESLQGSEAAWQNNGSALRLLSMGFEEAAKRERRRGLAEPAAAGGPEPPPASQAPVVAAMTGPWGERMISTGLSASRWLALEMGKQLQTRSGFAEPMRGDLERVCDPSSPDGLGEIDPNKECFNAWASPLHFVAAVGAHLDCLEQAGRFFHDDPVTKCRCEMVNPELVKLHLTECEVFARRWMTHDPTPPGKEITIRLRDADLQIRSLWWRMLEVNVPEGISFSACIRRTQPEARKLWTEANQQMVTLMELVGPPVPQLPQRGGQAQEDEGSSSEADEPASSRNSSAAAGTKRQRRTQDWYKEKVVRSTTRGPHKLRIAAESTRGRYCLNWNWSAVRCPVQTCNRRHACNVMTSENTVCGSTKHRGLDHKGPSYATPGPPSGSAK